MSVTLFLRSYFDLFVILFNFLQNMLSSIEEIELNKMVDDKIQLGDQLQKSLEPFLHIEGASRIQKKISREIEYLKKVYSVNVTYNRVFS